MAATNLNELLSLSKTQMKGLTKDELMDILLNAEKPSDNHSLVASIDALTKEIASMKTSLNESKAETKKQIDDLRKQVEKQNDVIAKQQLFLEQIDRKERECNILLFGVPDGSEALEGVTTDDEKVQKVWEAAGITCSIKSSRRLGKTVGPRKRPLLVVVESKAVRDATLEKAKNLRGSSDTYKKIYVKKDVHPSVRAEWKRLTEVYQREKNNPANLGFNINFDIKERKVYKEGVIIDQWNMQGF